MPTDTTITRYQPEVFCGEYEGMQPHSKGEWVTYEDYERALTAAHAARDADAARIDGMNRAINGLIEQLDAALRELDEAQARIKN